MKKVFFSIASLCMFVIYGTAQNTSPYWSLAGNSNATAASKLGTTNSIPLRFYTNNSLRMVILPNGNIGFGTSNPLYKMHVTIGSGTAVYGNGTTGVSGNGTSYGVYGNSASNYGVYGNSGYIGVYGTGTSYGVYGYSANGYGVTGTSGYLGVYGSGSTYGLYGSGGTYGAYTSGSSYGTYGTSSGGYGVYGNGTNYGTYGTGATYGATGSSAYIGVYGNSATEMGVYGYTGGGGTYQSGVYGYNAGYGYGVRAYGANGSGVYAQGGTWGGYFIGSVYTSGSYSSSDQKLKQNVREFSSKGMDIINKLHPREYEYRQDGDFKLMNLPKGSRFGLIANEVEQILPNLVKDAQFDPNTAKPQDQIGADGNRIAAQQGASAIIDFKTLNYTELIPILIKGIQELQGQVNELKAIISKNGSAASISSFSGNIKQNVPNPVKGNTIISYYLPENAGRGQIMITDIKGSVLKVYTAAKGEGQLTIKTGDLPAGTYNYTLYVNDKMIDTKQMVVAR